IVAGELRNSEYLEPRFLLGEIEPIGRLGTIGVPLRWIPFRARLVSANVGPAEIRIGRTVEKSLVHIDEQLTGLSVVVGDPDTVALIRLRVFPQLATFSRKRLHLAVNKN